MFRTPLKAFDFSRDLCGDTGSPDIRVRAGLHTGMVEIRDNDVFGQAVNYAARIVGVGKEPVIYVSKAVMDELDAQKAKSHANVKWETLKKVELKGIQGQHTVWFTSSF